MPGILKLLMRKERDIRSGQVAARLPGGTYRISVGNETVRARSAVTDVITVGSSVVVARSDDELFIVGLGEAQTRSARKVVVDG